jgi:hypothetical protein
MAIEKSLYEAPQGLGALEGGDEEAISVEIVDPEAVHIEGPGFEMHMEKEGEPEFDKNLAEDMDDNTLYSLSYELLGDFEEDLTARKEWLDAYVKGLKLLGLKYEERSEPWAGASGVFHPLLMESAVKFQSELIMETFPAAGPVRTEIVGKETQEAKEAAARVEADMNYMLTEVMTDYRPEHERLLLSTAISGNAFKKIYYDPSNEIPEAPFIPAEDVIVPYGASNIAMAERITHRMRKTKNEVRKLQVAGFYRDVDLGDPIHVMDEIEKEKAREQGFSASVDDRFQLLEMHVNMDLPGYEDEDDKGHPTGIALPYVVTIEKGTRTILSIRRNWLEDDKLKQRRQHFVHYGYIPGFGFYYFGLIHLIGGHTQTATSLLRQLIDAGTLSNLPGGLKAKGLRVKGDDTPIAPGEFRDVDLPSGSIRDNILPLPYKEPSQVLMALMDKVVEDGRQFAATADLNVSDMSANAPVGTTLAILERVLKVTTAVQARIHYTMKQEFKLLANIIRDNTPEDYDYEPASGDASAKKSDYDMVNVLPVSDPNASTMAQRLVQYQAVMQLAQANPDIYDMPYLHRQMIEVMGVKNANKIIPMEEDFKPMDPVSENMALINSKPIRAFMYQNHQAHIQVHMSAMKDPSMAQTVGQSPNAQKIAQAAYAHIMEHVAFQYRSQIQQKLGASLPPPPKAVLAGSDDDEDSEVGYLSPEEETQMSELAAMAAQQLLQQNQAQAAQQQAQQQAQDPIIQMQQAELQIKQQDLQLKAQMQQAEMQIKQAELQMEQQVKQLEMQLKQQQMQLDMQIKSAELQRQQQKDTMDAAGKADEIKVKESEVQRKRQKDILDASGKTDDHQLRRQEVANRGGVDQARAALEARKHEDDLGHRRAETALDAMKHRTNLEHQGEQSQMANEHQRQQAGLSRLHQRQQANANRQTANRQMMNRPTTQPPPEEIE